MSKRIEIEVFQTGTHTDSAGNTRTWTLDDLQQIAEKYNEQKDHEAPIVLGHPEHDKPAYGWVESLKVRGNKLVAELKELAGEFVEWVKTGRYKKRSIALYSDGLLRHIGFLGAMPPAVKGLADPQFTEGAFAEYEFSDNRMPTVATILRRIREWWIAQGTSIEDVDKVIPQTDLEWLGTNSGDFEYEYLNEQVNRQQAQIDDLRAIVLNAPIYSEDTSTMADDKNKGSQGDPPNPDTAKGTEYAEKISLLQTENTALKGEVGLLQKQVADLERQNREASFREFLDSPDMKVRVPPAERENAMAELRTASRMWELEFADGTKKSALEAKKEQMLRWPPVIEFGEKATKGRAAGGGASNVETGFRLAEHDEFDPERRELTLKVRKVADEKNITFNEALGIVLAEQPTE